MSRRYFEAGLAMRAVDGTVRLIEEAIADADGPEVANLMRVMKGELDEVRSAIDALATPPPLDYENLPVMMRRQAD